MSKLSVGTITPIGGATGVSVATPNIIYEATLREYLEPPTVPFAGYWTGGWLDIISISNIVLTISPSHSAGTPVALIDPYGTGIEQSFRITIPNAAVFTGSTLYEWSLTADIEHGLFGGGSATINYTTTDQILGFGGDAAPAMTFTTEYVPTVPSKPINPTPADAADTIALGLAAIEWEDGGGADDFDVYFGVSGDMELVSSGQAGTSFAMAVPLLYNTVYQWRIDANNAYGTTTGDVWSFTSLVFAPPLPSGDGAGGEFGGEGGKNNMVTVKRLVAAANNTVFYEDE